MVAGVPACGVLDDIAPIAPMTTVAETTVNTAAPRGENRRERWCEAGFIPSATLLPDRPASAAATVGSAHFPEA